MLNRLVLCGGRLVVWQGFGYSYKEYLHFACL